MESILGFEVLFTSHSKKDGGGYDLENKETFKRIVGNPETEISLEELAKVILKQLARRDKFVIGVEVFEFAKKKISFSETTGGIIIKHKKFNLDQGELTSQDIEKPHTLELNPDSNVHCQTHLGENLSLLANPYLAQPKQYALREEVYDPQFPGLTKESKRRGYKFTVGKRYPIYEEKPAPGGLQAGINYKTHDDEGNVQILNSLHFRPPVKLVGEDFTEEDSLAKKKPDDEFNQDTPDIRSMARGMIRG